MEKNPSFTITWPLGGGGPSEAFPDDPNAVVSKYAPPSAELHELNERTDLPDGNEEAERKARNFRETLPPMAPEWMRAARALANALEGLIARGTVDELEESAILRAWAAWSLGGVSEPHILKVTHVVSRAYTAIREVPRASVGTAVAAAAGVLHAGLPTLIRDRMPFPRTIPVVRALSDEADAWAAVVEGASELLGWKDFAKSHAASVIRAVIERDRGSRGAR
jgi:hypothetical protein